MKINEIKDEVGEWSEENFGEQPNINPLMGIDEEKGELVHSILKTRQGIRLDESGVGTEAEMDAIGDMFIYFCDYCYRNDMDFPEVASTATKMDEVDAWKELNLAYTNIVASEPELSNSDIHWFLQSLITMSYSLEHKFEDCIQLAWFEEVSDREWDSRFN